jgi:hypothetical protein
MIFWGYAATTTPADPTICNLSSGTINPETNECELCLNPNNCNCIIDTQTFDVSCDDFCIGDEYDYCGTIFCSADVGGTSSCEGSDISASDDDGGGEERTMISISISCDMTRVCTCVAEFGGGECAACDGAGDGIDCSNVRVVGDDGDDITSGPRHRHPHLNMKGYRGDTERMQHS